MMRNLIDKSEIGPMFLGIISILISIDIDCQNIVQKQLGSSGASIRSTGTISFTCFQNDTTSLTFQANAPQPIQKKCLNASKSRKSTSSVHGSRDELLAKIRVLKNEKEQKMKQKQVIDAEIKTVNEQVLKKVSSIKVGMST
jgi:hypothetical protein